MFLTHFALTFHHKYTLSEIEGMIPWERDVFVKFVTDYIQEENERLMKEKDQTR